MGSVQKLTMQGIGVMHANEFHKDDFRQLLRCAQAINLGLYYVDELAGYKSKLMLGDADDRGEIETDHYMTGECIKTLAAILELCGALAKAQVPDHSLLAEATQKFCSMKLRYGSELSQGGAKIMYFRSNQLGILPDEFVQFRRNGVPSGFEFCLPHGMGALLNLLYIDSRAPGYFDRMHCALVTEAVFRAMDDMALERELRLSAMENRVIREYYW